MANEDAMALLREGGQSSEANFLMVINSNWLRFSPFSSHPIRIKEALTFSRGMLYKLRFKRAQPLGYLMDFNPNHAKKWISRNLPAPSNAEAEQITNNKDKTVRLLREQGIKNIPMTWEIGSDTSYAKARTKIWEIFSQSREIVVKPTTGSCGLNIEFFSVDDREKAVECVHNMLAKGYNILVQERLVPPFLKIEKEMHDWNFRVFVSKNNAGQPVVSDIAVRYDGTKGPVNISLGAKVMTFEELAARLQLSPIAAEKLKHDTEELSIRAFSVVEEAANKAQKKQRPWRDLDFMGIDIMARDERGSLVPYVIEINDYHSGGMWDLDNVVSGDRIGRSSRDFVKTMARKAKSFIGASLG
jgi:hypothetical protein